MTGLRLCWKLQKHFDKKTINKGAGTEGRFDDFVSMNFSYILCPSFLFHSNLFSHSNSFFPIFLGPLVLDTLHLMEELSTAGSEDIKLHE